MNSDSTKTNYTITYTYNSVKYTITTTVTAASTTDGTTYSVSKAKVTAEAYPAASIVINTPNALVDYSGATIDTTRDEGKAVTVNNFGKDGTSDAAYLAYSALYYVGEALASTIEPRPDMLTYSEFTDSSTGGNNSAITPSLFLAGKECTDRVTEIVDAKGTDSTTTENNITTKITYTEVTENGTTTYTKTTTTTEYCAYIAAGKDLILPEKYLSTDYEITYESKDTSVLSNLGNALKAGKTTLTATVKNGKNTLGTVTFTVHVIDSTDTSSTGAKAEAARVLIKSYLQKYWVDGNTVTGSPVEHKNGFYSFAYGIQLPVKDEDLGIEYSYALYTTTDTDGVDKSNIVTVDNTEYVKAASTQYTAYYSPSGKAAQQTDDVAYVIEKMDVDCSYLDVKLVSGDSATSLDVLDIYSSSVSETEADAYTFFNLIYGSAIVYPGSAMPLIYAEKGKLMFSGSEITESTDLGSNYTSLNISELMNTANALNIKSVTYTLNTAATINGATDSARNYYTLTTTTGYLLTAIQSIANIEDGIICTITFTDGSTEELPLNIVYATGGTGAATYMSVYNVFKANAPASTYESFVMNFNSDIFYTVYEFSTENTTEKTVTDSTDSTKSYTYYATSSGDDALTLGMPDGVTVTLATSTSDTNDATTTVYTPLANFAYGKSNSSASASITTLKTSDKDGHYTYWTKEVGVYTYSSIVEGFKAWFASQTTYEDLKALAAANAVWIINIDQTELLYTDQTILMTYNYADTNYKITATNITITPYTQGGYYVESDVSLIKIEGGVHLDTSATADSTGNYAGNVIVDENLFYWMKSQLTGGTDNFIPASSLGQEAELDSTSSETYTFKDSSGTDHTATLSSITNWWGVQYLTGLTKVNLTGITMSVSTENINKLTAVEVLTLNKMTDSTTSALLTEKNLTKELNLTKLRELYIENNNFTTFGWLLEAVESGNLPALQKVHIVGNSGDGTYTGSEGICNYYIYEELALKGVTVYNSTNSNGVEIPFAESTDLNDYRRLKSIVYQEILSGTTSIEKCYEEFTNLKTTDLNMEGTYTTTKITWKYEGDDPTSATYFEAYVYLSDGTELIARFHVERKTSSTSSGSTDEDTSDSTGTDGNTSGNTSTTEDNSSS